jgi:hypothetical protein
VAWLNNLRSLFTYGGLEWNRHRVADPRGLKRTSDGLLSFLVNNWPANRPTKGKKPIRIRLLIACKSRMRAISNTFRGHCSKQFGCKDLFDRRRSWNEVKVVLGPEGTTQPRVCHSLLIVVSVASYRGIVVSDESEV